MAHDDRTVVNRHRVWLLAIVSIAFTTQLITPGGPGAGRRAGWARPAPGPPRAGAAEGYPRPSSAFSTTSDSAGWIQYCPFAMSSARWPKLAAWMRGWMRVDA